MAREAAKRLPVASATIDCGTVLITGTTMAETVQQHAKICFDDVERNVIERRLEMKALRVTVEVV